MFGSYEYGGYNVSQLFISNLQFCQSSKMTHRWDSPASPPGHSRTAVHSVWKQMSESFFVMPVKGTVRGNDIFHDSKCV